MCQSIVKARVGSLFVQANGGNWQAIVVEGPPWNTRVMTYVKFRGFLPPLSGAAGKPYENEVMQLMHLRWGRIASVITLEDTQRFMSILPALAAAGIADATAAPIADPMPA
jgi:hypothetical protein